LNTSKISDVLSPAILEKATGNFNERSAVFMMIPASTQLKNINRHKGFCQIMTKKLKISNGWNGIKIMYDREGYVGANESRIENL
jgi:hypothetical protein